MVEKRIKLLQYDKKIHLPGEDHTQDEYPLVSRDSYRKLDYYYDIII